MRIIEKLEAAMPQAPVELTYRTPWELLVATILSAQCTDARVNQVTPVLFERFKSPEDFANADQAELESLIRPTGFFRNKAKNLIACGRKLVEEFHGKVPDSMEALTTLPGIGRKTANVILGACFGKSVIVVDTHVKRVSNRLQLSTHSDPAKIERDLQTLLPRSHWTSGSQRLLLHGRYVCTAHQPHCGSCVVNDECSWKGKRISL